MSIVLLVANIITGCKLDTGSHQSPYVAPYNFLRFHATSTPDTMRVYGLNKLDTIAIGDTVMFDVTMASYFSSLKTFVTAWDTTSLYLSFGPLTGIQQALRPESVPESGILYFYPNYNMASVRMLYIPRKQGNIEISMMVESDDTKFPTYSMSFIQPVK